VVRVSPRRGRAIRRGGRQVRADVGPARTTIRARGLSHGSRIASVLPAFANAEAWRRDVGFRVRVTQDGAETAVPDRGPEGQAVP
jgi:hypothetical protein